MARLSKRQWMIQNTLGIFIDVSVLLAALIVVFPSAWPFLFYQSPLVLFPFLQLPISQLIASVFVSLTGFNALCNFLATVVMKKYNIEMEQLLIPHLYQKDLLENQLV